MVHDSHPGVLPDASLTWWIFERSSNNYNRWYRDGLSNYAAYRYCERIEAALESVFPGSRPDHWMLGVLPVFLLIYNPYWDNQLYIG